MPALLVAAASINQVPILQPIANALAVQLLRAGEPERLRKLGYDFVILDALDFADAHGVELPPVYALLASLSGGRYRFEKHVERDPSRLNSVVDWLEANAPGLLSGLVTALAPRHDLSVAIPALGRLLRHANAQTRKGAAQALAGCAERGVRLDAAAAELRSALESPETVFAAAVALAWHALAQTPVDWKAVDGWLAHPSADVAIGVLAVLGDAWLRRRSGSSKLLSRIAAALDGPAEVRKSAAKILLKGRAKGLRTGIDSAVLARLVQAMLDPAKADAVATFLYAAVASNRRRAQQVLALLESNHSADAPALKRLADVCREVVLAQHRPVCSICRHLPRSANNWSGLPAKMD